MAGKHLNKLITLFPVKENIGRGTGIGRFIPTYPHST